MNTETETLVSVLRDRMEKMTDQERIDLLDSLFAGFCKHCGADIGDGRCYCLRDD